jgi:hypothetical protein
MEQTSITAAGAIDTFLVLLIGIGPKIALVPFLEITAPLDPAAKQRVLRKMMTTAATVAVLLMALGELLRALLHFTIGSLSIAGGVILLVLAVWMVLGPAAANSHRQAEKDPMQLAQCGIPLGEPGEREARREPHAGHRESLRLLDRCHRRAADPRRPSLERSHRAGSALGTRAGRSGLGEGGRAHRADVQH